MKIACALALGLLLAHPVLGKDLYFETQVKLRIAKKDEKRSKEGGLEHVPFRIWLPDGVKTIRGVTFNPVFLQAIAEDGTTIMSRPNTLIVE